ncbi:MAG: B12-binding domain-containing radical SAM protein [Oligoflexia bacterium]|nr:B12-binding domain-containing radical SAM protein [Oligoflexia bacterium]
MKKVIIISYAQPLLLGSRLVSSLLKKHSHEVTLLNLNHYHFLIEKVFSDDFIRKLALFCQDFDAICFSFMTQESSLLIPLVVELRKILPKLYVFGGIHPTHNPLECLDYADVVFLGESEYSFLQAIENDFSNLHELDNVGYKDEFGKKIINKIASLKNNLNELPYPDYSIENKYVVSADNTIIPVTREMQKEFFKQSGAYYGNFYSYTTLTSRGCPHKCSYCANLNEIREHGFVPKLRFRSVENIIRELEEIRALYPEINFFLFYDDNFASRKDEEILEFCREYKKRINAPFAILVSPRFVSDFKLSHLVDAGLRHLQMGIQSGSDEINRSVFLRNISGKQTIQAIQIINKYKKYFTPWYDFITDIPYDTLQSKRETIRLLSKIPKPFKLQIFSLVLFPSTSLYNRIKEEMPHLLYKYSGENKTMSKLNNLNDLNYYDTVLLVAAYTPNIVLRILSSKVMFFLFDRKFFSPVMKTTIASLRMINRATHINHNKIRAIPK